MARTVKEWKGATDDAKIPPRVRLRVFDRYNGTCHLSGRKIMPGEPWDCDHIVALINGGEHRENNLAPALRAKHREKTREDVAEKSAMATVRKKHHSVGGFKRKIQSQGFRRAPSNTKYLDRD